MPCFTIFVLLSFLSGMAAIIFLGAAIYNCNKNDKYAFMSLIATFLSILGSLFLGFNVDVPSPTILPLDSETRVFFNQAEIEVKSIEWGLLETYYTIDGTDPMEGSKYLDRFMITKSTTVSARNKFLWWWSDISERAYTVESKGNIATVPDLTPIPVSTPTPISTSIPIPISTPIPTNKPVTIPTTVPEINFTPSPEPTPVPAVGISIANPIEITANNFSGSIIEKNQKIYYCYTPAVSGTYRFEFDSSDINTNYKFAIQTINNDVKASGYFRDSGKTVDLEAENTILS